MDQKQSGYTSIDEYIASFPLDIQQNLQRIRAVISEAAPEATEKVSYQMPTFYLNGNLVHFAVQKHHIGFYPTPSGIDHFSKELSSYKTSKGAAQFPLDRPIPYDLIRRITAFRYQENLVPKKLRTISTSNK